MVASILQSKTLFCVSAGVAAVAYAAPKFVVALIPANVLAVVFPIACAIAVITAIGIVIGIYQRSKQPTAPTSVVSIPPRAEQPTETTPISLPITVISIRSAPKPPPLKNENVVSTATFSVPYSSNPKAQVSIYSGSKLQGDLQDGEVLISLHKKEKVEGFKYQTKKDAHASLCSFNNESFDPKASQAEFLLSKNTCKKAVLGALKDPEILTVFVVVATTAWGESSNFLGQIESIDLTRSIELGVIGALGQEKLPQEDKLKIHILLPSEEAAEEYLEKYPRVAGVIKKPLFPPTQNLRILRNHSEHIGDTRGPLQPSGVDQVRS